MKQATLKKFGFTRRVGHRGEKVSIDNPAYVEDTRIPCLKCNLKFKKKLALGSHIAFKHGKYAEVFKFFTQTFSSFPLKSKEIPRTSVASISLAETPTSDSPSTSTTVDTTNEVQAPEAVEITDNQPKIKQRRIKHDVPFKVEVLQKKDNGMTTTDLLATYKSFNFDKTKVPKHSEKEFVQNLPFRQISSTLQRIICSVHGS